MHGQKQNHQRHSKARQKVWLPNNCCGIVKIQNHHQKPANSVDWTRKPNDNTIAALATTFARSKKEKTHARNEKEYEKYYRVMESIRTLILQTVDMPYLEALKEEYTGSDGILPTKMICCLWSKISKVPNQDKAAVKREIFIPWKQPTLLSAYFKKIETAKKKLEEWNVT